MKKMDFRSGVLWKLFAVFAALLVSGCGPGVIRTELTTFNDWSAAPPDKSYVFSRTLQYKNSLEVQAYEDMVREELEKLGFREAKEPAAANLLVTLRPSIAVYDYGFPYSDPWMFQNHRWHGAWPGYWPYYYPYAYPFYEWDRGSPVYQRKLQLEIDQQGPPPLKRLYEATAVNEGWDGSLMRAMPYLVLAIFSDFPGGNGQTRTIAVPVR